MKKLNKKGFTLIELLAVIVILAIILVIAVPSVLSIQNNAKEGTAKDEAILALKGYEMCISAEATQSSCTSTTTLANYYENASGVKTLTAGSTANTIKAFKYSTNGNYCVEYTNATGASTTAVKAAIKDKGEGVTVTSGACS